jgi:transcriptional regulator with XRE-family HTH domain
MNIGSKVKALRHARGLLSAELAERADVAQSTISEVESDKRSPTLDTLEKICAALHVPIMEVLPLEHHLDKKAEALSNDELELITLLQKMKSEERLQLLNLLRSLLAKRK